MNLEEAQYVVVHYPSLLDQTEAKALRHHLKTLDLIDEPDEKRRAAYNRIGWLSSNPEVLALLENGFDNFLLACAERIVNDHPGDVYFNLCAKCNQLARTPLAKQCRHCGFDWH